MTPAKHFLAAIGLAGAVALAPLPLLAFGSDTSSSTTQSSGPSKNYVSAEKKVKAGDYADAIPLLEKVVKSEPKNADALNYLGYSHRKLGDQAKALGYYQQALAINAKHRGANEYLGELYLEMKQLDKAEERLKVLSEACSGCEESVELKEKIDAFKAGKSS
jgi:tetratricopeptide (TPR) repeat protein